jgi:transposase-like protein
VTKAKNRSAEEWARIVRAWERSGRPTREFAEEHGLSRRSLVWWRWKLKQGRQSGQKQKQRPPKSVQLVRVKLDSEPQSQPLTPESPTVAWELETAQGHVLRVYEGPHAAGLRDAIARLTRTR